MKHRLHFSRSFAGALICALLWFALWLIPFSPQPTQTARTTAPRPAAILPGAAGSTPEVRSPSLFALPSEKGFSGAFPEAHINLLTPSGGTATNSPLPGAGIRAAKPSGDLPRYLPRQPTERETPDQISLQEAIPKLKADLPAPVIYPTAPVPPPKQLALFLSPELQERADEPLTLNITGTLPPSVRIYIGIQPDGTVDQVLFDTPVENKALAGAVRKLRFQPAAGRTDSWLDLRFTPGGTS